MSLRRTDHGAEIDPTNNLSGPVDSGNSPSVSMTSFTDVADLATDVKEP
jgi:hypothetical protein